MLLLNCSDGQVESTIIHPDPRLTSVGHGHLPRVGEHIQVYELGRGEESAGWGFLHGCVPDSACGLGYTF